MLGIGAEHHAGVVVVALDKAEVDHQAVAEPERRERAVQRARVVQGLGKRRMPDAEALRLRKDLRAAEQAGQLADRLGVQRRFKPVEHVAERRVILRLDRHADVLPAVVGNRELVGQQAEKPRVADFEPEALRTGRKRVDRRGDHLDVGP